MPRFKKLKENQVKVVEAEVKMMLHASRDCLRNRGVDTTKITFDCHDGYYGEAFGIMRALKTLGYGYFGSNNIQDKEDPYRNLKFWFDRLEGEVLAEEGYGGSNECNYCLEHYSKDAMRARNSNGEVVHKQPAEQLPAV